MRYPNHFQAKLDKLQNTADKLVYRALDSEQGTNQYRNYIQRYLFMCFLIRTLKERGVYNITYLRYRDCIRIPIQKKWPH